MKFICHDYQKHFIMAIKSNRLVFLSEQDKRNGRSQHVEDMYFRKINPSRIGSQASIFPSCCSAWSLKSTGILYLVYSDLGCDGDTITMIYKKRWKVEVCHKTLKSNAAAKSPAHTVHTQSNHLFLSIYSAFPLETLSLRLKMNHFQLRSKLYMTTLRSAFKQLQQLMAA